MGHKNEKLPCSLEAERAYFGVILLNNSAGDVSKLEPEAFSIDSHRQIHRAMQKLALAGAGIDIVSLAEELSSQAALDRIGGPSYISSLTDGMPKLENVDHYARIIRKHAQRRKLIYGTQELQRLAYQGKDPEALARLASGWVRKLSAHIDIPVRAQSFFRTPAQVFSDAAEPVEQVAAGIYRGSLTEITGPPKNGKTTYCLGFCRSMQLGIDFIGRPTVKGPVFYLSEQSQSTLMMALDRAGLSDAKDFHFLCWPNVSLLPWPEVAEIARNEAKKAGARLLVVDTLGQFLGLTGDQENDSGTALEALRPLQAAAAEGLAVVVVRHERKGGGNVGEASRGSSAFAGAVDTILSLRKPDGAQRPTIRVLRGISRFGDVPDELHIELQGEQFVALGTSAQIAHDEGREKIIVSLPTSEAEALTLGELVSATKVKRVTAQRILGELDGDVNRIGSGKKGDPYRWFSNVKIHSAQTYIHRWAERNEGAQQ